MSLVPEVGGVTAFGLAIVIASKLPGNLLGNSPLVVLLLSIVIGLMAYTFFAQALGRAHR